MSKIKLSKAFPSDSFARTVASAVMGIICENIPALKGRNLQSDIAEHYDARREANFGDRSETSAFAAAFISREDQERITTANLSSIAIDVFQDRLAKEIGREIREQGDDFKFISFYICDLYDTRPGWLSDLIEAVCQESGLNLYDLMPYREKIAITVHKDGEIFWGTSGYGPATPSERLADYIGKPEGALPFVDLNKIWPDTTQAYVLDLGCYKPLIVPEDESQEETIDDKVFFRQGSINQIIHELEATLGNSPDNPSFQRNNRIKELFFLKSILQMWRQNNLDGYPCPRIAFVPEALAENCLEKDFRDPALLMKLKQDKGTLQHYLNGWECPVEFESPHQSKWSQGIFRHTLPSGNYGPFPFMAAELKEPLNSYGKITTVFKLGENGHFRLITHPFYLYRIPQSIQTGVADRNICLNEGELLAFRTEGCAIGQYKRQSVEIYRLPKTALPYLREVTGVPLSYRPDQCDNEDENLGHFYGVEVASSPPDLTKLPTMQPRLHM